jgi:hypothetical protein
MTNDTQSRLRALDEVAPPAQWDGIVAAASGPGATRLPVPTDTKRRRPAVLVAAVMLLVIAGATAMGLAVRSDRQVEVTSTPASEPVAPDGSTEPGQEESPPVSMRWEDAVRVIVYLHQDADAEQRDALRASIEADPAVEAFEYLDRDAAYEDFLEKFEDDPEFTAVVDPEIMPTSFKLVPLETDSDSLSRLKASYDGAPGVAGVVIAPDQ